MTPRVSILTVVRNDVAGAVATLASVFRQTVPDYEVIVRDGGSTDGTVEALRAFGDWIDVLETGPDGGIYDAMNRALARARGDWVLYLNAGDSLADTDVLARVLPLLDGATDILAGQAIAAETGEVHEYLAPDMFWAGSVCDHQATFVRRSLAEELRFDTRYRIAGDLDFFTRARDRGARFRFEPVVVAVKPFARGASSDFMARFRERAAILLPRYGDTHPVRAALERSLRTHLRRTQAAPPGALKAMDLDALLALEARWRAILSG